MIHGAGWLGSRTLAGLIFGAPVDVPPRPTSNVTIVVAGIERTGYLGLDSLDVKEELGGRGSCTFTLIDPAGTLHVAVGEPVQAYYRGTLIFAGTVDDFSEHTPDNDPCIWIDVECVDYNQLADRHLVAAVYENKTLREIVTDIIDTQSGDLGERLRDDGVTYTTDSITNHWTTINYAAFDYEFASDCFDALSELTGYAWWIDYEKVFHMHEPETCVAPVSLDDDVWQHYTKLQHAQNRESYRNIQYLRGGKARTEPTTSALVRTMRFKGDGETKNFNLDLEVADRPLLYIDSGSGFVAVSSGDIGIREQATDKEWYYAIGEKEISQNTDDAYTALTSSQTLMVKWQGFFPIIEQVRDDTEISMRRAVEGGTGVYTAIEEQEDINDADLARDWTQGLIDSYGKIPQHLEWSTTTHGFHAGQLLQVNIGRHNAAGAFIIERVSFQTISEDQEQPFRYSVKAVFQRFRGNWIRFYKAWVNRGRPWVVNENDKVQTYRSVSSEVQLTDSYQTGVPEASWGGDRYGWAITGATNIKPDMPPTASLIGYRKEFGATYGVAGANATGPLYGPIDEYRL